MKEYLVDDVNKRCPNCNTALPDRAKFCHDCGQKFTTGKIKLRVLLAEFFEAVFNIESRAVKTLGAIFIPGKLTNEYFKGRHKTYAAPIRLFLMMAILHFASMAYYLDNVLHEDIKKQEGRQLANAYRLNFIHQLDTLVPGISEQYPHKTEVYEALDSVKQFFRQDTRDSMTIGINFFVGEDSIYKKKVSREDIFRLSPEEMIEKYEIEGFWNRLIFGQFIRVNTDLENLPGFFISNLTWMALLMMPALALILKILYIRREYYYVEHLVFSFHYHAFAFLLVAIGFLLQPYWKGAIPVAFGIVLIYLFIAMKRVYRQGLIKTFFKYFFLNNMYLFIFTIFLSFSLLISALLY